MIRGRTVNVLRTCFRSNEWKLMGRRRIATKLKEPEERYHEFLIGYLRTNTDLNVNKLNDLAAKTGLTREELFLWYNEARGDQGRESLTFYKKLSAADLRWQLRDIHCISEGRKDDLAYRLFLAKAGPDQLREQQALKKKHDVQKARRQGKTQRFMNRSFLDYQIKVEDVDLFRSLLDLETLEELCKVYQIDPSLSPKEKAYKVHTIRRGGQWTPDEMTAELCCHYFSKFQMKDLRTKLEPYNVNDKAEMCRTSQDLARFLCQKLGFDITFDADFFLRTLKHLSRKSKEDILSEYDLSTFRLSDDKTLLAHRILENFFPEYDVAVFQVNYVKGVSLSYLVKDFYTKALRDPEVVFSKILDLKVSLEENPTFASALERILETLEIKCDQQDCVVEFELHQFVHFLRSGRRNTGNLLKFYCEMANIILEQRYQPGFYTKLLHGMGFTQYEEEEEFIPVFEDEDGTIQKIIPSVITSGTGMVVAMPASNVVDFQTDGAVEMGRIVVIGDTEFEVVNCISATNFVYRCLSFQPPSPDSVEIDDEVTIQPHNFLVPRMTDVSGKTITPAGDVINDDIFTQSEPVERSYHSHITLRETCRDRVHKNYHETPSYATISTDNPTVDCLFPVIYHGVHVAVGTHIEHLRRWMEDLTCRISYQQPVIFGSYFPSENVAMHHMGKLRSRCKKDLTVLSSYFSDEPLMKWHMVETGVLLAEQDPSQVVVLPLVNHTNQMINKIFSSFGAQCHPKLHPSYLGHNPMKIQVGQATSFPSTTARIPQVFGVQNVPNFTLVLGVLVDPLELPYAAGMFDWAHSVWVIKNDAGIDDGIRPYVCTDTSACIAIERGRLRSHRVDDIKACRNKLQFGTQLNGILNSQFCGSNKENLHKDHVKFLENVYEPMLDILSQQYLKNSLDVVGELSPDREAPRLTSFADAKPSGFESTLDSVDFDFDDF